MQLEYEKVKTLLGEYCKTAYAKERASNLRIHTKKEFIDLELKQSYEYKLLLQTGQYFHNDFILNLVGELKLLAIPGAMLSGEQFLHIRKLAENTGSIFRWFDNERRIAYPALKRVIEDTWFEKKIIILIDEILDESGNVKDSASEALTRIRMNLYRKRNELRRIFDRMVTKLNKLGYLADIEESFINGRRVLAVFAEQKRMIKGILHGESDSRRTSFIEPEETTGLNNDIFSLENEERKEIYKILRQLTVTISAYAPLLKSYQDIAGEFDFICAKAKWAILLGGNYPQVRDKAHLHLIQAYHPLLLIYNKNNNKPTVPVNITLNENNRILVISGPNAGGKTVTLKTV
ncbi:MAG: DNA mismatch repair protein MutS, partial [Ferruginibacter sp.]